MALVSHVLGSRSARSADLNIPTAAHRNQAAKIGKLAHSTCWLKSSGVASLTIAQERDHQRLIVAITENNAEKIARIVIETDPRVLYLALHDIRRMSPPHPGLRGASDVTDAARLHHRPSNGAGRTSGHAGPHHLAFDGGGDDHRAGL